jgi:hypothetical protein
MKVLRKHESFKILSHKPVLFECDSHSIIPLPDDAAGELQSIVAYDQGEALLDRNDIDALWKLDRRACLGKVAHDAWVFVAAVVCDGGLVDGVPGGNSGFDHLKCIWLARFRRRYCAVMNISSAGGYPGMKWTADRVGRAARWTAFTIENRQAGAHFPKFVVHRRTQFHELRKAMGTSKPMILVPLSI